MNRYIPVQCIIPVHYSHYIIKHVQMLLYLLLSFCICANKCESSEHLGHCKANWSRRNKGICSCVTVRLSYEEGYSSKELFWRFCLLKFSVEHGADLLTLIRTVEQRNEHNNGLHPCLPKVSLPRLLAGCPKCSRSSNGQKTGQNRSLGRVKQGEKGQQGVQTSQSRKLSQVSLDLTSSMLLCLLRYEVLCAFIWLPLQTLPGCVLCLLWLFSVLSPQKSTFQSCNVVYRNVLV